MEHSPPHDTTDGDMVKLVWGWLAREQLGAWGALHLAHYVISSNPTTHAKTLMREGLVAFFPARFGNLKASQQQAVVAGCASSALFAVAQWGRPAFFHQVHQGRGTLRW
jgi:hypothetical protein